MANTKEEIGATMTENINIEDDGSKKGSEHYLSVVQAMSEEQFQEHEKNLKRKLDLRLMSMIWLIYMLNYLDRNNIAASDVAGIRQTLHLSSTQFSTAVSLLFVGYILMQIPSNMFLAQVRPSIYIPACMALWGIISTCTGAVQSAGGLYAARFFLGIVEAAFYPGSVFLISTWYKRSEMGLRVAILYSASQIGSATSGLIAAGVSSGLNGAQGLPAWKWIFIIEGSITVCIAIIAGFILPDFPSNTRWLSPTEQAVAEWRLIKDAGQVDEDNATWSSGFNAAFTDWRTYAFALMFFCVLVTTSTQNFFPAVVNTLGFSHIQTLLLTVPPYILGAIITVANNLSADHFGNSSFHVMLPLVFAIAGFIIASASLETGPRYFAMCIMIAGGHGANAVVLAWSQKTMLRPRLKRAVVAAFVNACGNAAQIWTAYLYYAKAAPRYTLAMSVNAGFGLGAIVLALVMRMVLLRANQKLDSGADISKVMKGEAGREIEGISNEERLARKDGFRFIA